MTCTARRVSCILYKHCVSPFSFFFTCKLLNIRWKRQRIVLWWKIMNDFHLRFWIKKFMNGGYDDRRNIVMERRWTDITFRLCVTRSFILKLSRQENVLWGVEWNKRLSVFVWPLTLFLLLFSIIGTLIQ